MSPSTPGAGTRALWAAAVVLILAFAAACGGDAAPGDGATDVAGGEAIKLAALSDCEEFFGGFHEQDLAGVGAAFAEYAGAVITNPAKPSDGFTGASVAGVPVELVGVGCADDTAEAALAETRRLMEELGADIMIGPSSEAESIAVADYAQDHPHQTFLNGTAGLMETTMHMQAPNFFSFNGDGAQWNAGTGDYAKNVLGWDTAAVIMDDYHFGWTSAAGFIAGFCAAGGDVISRVFPPPGAADYSAFIDMLPDPDEVDGYFWAVGGSGALSSLQAFKDAKGPLRPERHMGTLLWEFAPGGIGAMDPDLEGAYLGSFGVAPDLNLPSVAEHTAIIDRHFDDFPAPDGDPAPAATQAHSGFLVNYFVAAKALIQALEEVGGDISDNQQALQAALGSLTVQGPYGSISLDANRQAIADSYVRQITAGPDGTLRLKTVAVVPKVDQSFGGAFSPDIGPPSREVPACEPRNLPWIGASIPVVDGELQN